MPIVTKLAPAILLIVAVSLAGCQGKPKSVAVKDAGFKVASPAEQESFAFQLPSKTPKPGDCLIVAKKVGNVSELKFIKCPKGVTP